LEKTFSLVRQFEQEYGNGVQKFGELHQTWKTNMSMAAVDFQQLEEDRFNFLRGTLWKYANFLSGTCVMNDESSERIRVGLERCNFAADLNEFISAFSTGNQIPGIYLLTKNH
jgi:hypothetical protein